MTDLQVLLIAAVCAGLLAGYLALCERVHG